jgi:purine nucleosidase
VVDWWAITGEAPNALVINEIDADGFYALINERLARL